MHARLWCFLACLSIGYSYNAVAAEQESGAATAYNAEALYEKVFGKKAEIPAQFQATLRIDNVEKGKITVFSEDRKQVSHVAANVLKPLTPFLKQAPYQQLQQAIDERKRLSIAALKTVDVTVKYNVSNLSLDLVIAAAQRKPGSIRLQTQQQRPAAPDNLIEPALYSSYINLHSSLSHENSSNRELQDGLRLQVEHQLKLGELSLENNFSYNGSNKDFKRDSTRAVFDDQTRMLRLQMGDINTAAQGFQQSETLLGVQVSKDFRLDPYFDSGVEVSRHFVLGTEAHVEVYINETLKTTRRLAAGEYTLDDLGIYSGSNDVHLKITDSFGKESEQLFSVFHDSRLLQPGVSRYELGAGMASYQASGGQRYDKSNQLAAGYYETGVTETLTASASAKLTEQAQQYGAGLVTPTALGNIKMTWGATDYTNQKPGQAVQLQYTRNSELFNAQNRIALSAEYRDKRFAPLKYSSHNGSFRTSTEQQKLKERYVGRVNQSLGKGLSTSLRAEYLREHGSATPQLTTGLSIRKQLDAGRQLTLDFEQQKRDGGSVEKNVKLNYRARVGDLKEDPRYKTFTANYDDENHATLLGFQVNPRNVVGEGSLSGAANLLLQKDTHALSANLAYRDPTFEVSASHRLYQTGNNDDRLQQHSTLNVNTALVYADQTWAVSRPVQNGFAILKTDSAYEQPIAVSSNNGEFTQRIQDDDRLPDHYDAVLRSEGTAVVSHLSSYQYQTIYLDDTELPTGNELTGSAFNLYPGYKSAYVLDVGVEQGYTLDGTLLDNEQETLKLAGGMLRQTNDNKREIPFFTNRSGRFRIPTVPAGTYTLLLNDYPKIRYTLQIPEQTEQLYKLGELTLDVSQ